MGLRASLREVNMNVNTPGQEKTYSCISVPLYLVGSLD
ncbi:hypothetical protein IC006_2319 [Sulfuracidifex tepidarius]|uniref:Uncharacterized protein n=1 Tax=Sulfuracidifex tepidarius TaxID=1294262 RepID=A0A510DXP5_9CREN|nr:hypothetical protein IC006_2319 [Sulfuracidifex tepidarius]BBG27771.1 hypothetical protein IC007_2325 [Sulfuracidifex tepidarius]